MIKTLSTSILVLLISCFITLSSALGNQTGNLQPFNSKTGFYYTVQKGDTLWDLSQKFYSSEWDWPGLWELNEQIKNPHIIYPGERLRVFFKGGLSLQNEPIYVEPEKADKPAEVKPVEIKIEKVETPAPIKKEVQLTYLYPFIDRVGFIKKRAISPVGKILRSKNNADLISENDIVYIEASDEDSLIPGKRYQIYKTTKVARKKIRHAIKGIIQIEEKKEKYFTAKIIKAFIAINPDDLIMEFMERDKEFIVKNNNAKIDAKLICNDEDDSMFGERQLVYMDCGSNQDIELGQIYTIYKNLDKKKASFSSKTIKIEPIMTGKLIVLHTEDISSTALIFASEQEIHIGDPVH